MGITELFIAEQNTDTQRICGTCGQIKSVDEFYRDGKDSNGNVRYRRDCKDCYKKARLLEAKMKERRNSNV